MKNWFRGLLVSLLALGSVGAASTIARADIEDIPACADFDTETHPVYTGTEYLGPTPVPVDRSDETQSAALNALGGVVPGGVPTESEGTLTVHVDLVAPSCSTVTYRLTVIYPDGTTQVVEQQGDGSEQFDLTAPVSRHASACIQGQISSIDENGLTQDVGPDEAPGSACFGDDSGAGNWR